jgi:hypothetical protein
MYWQGSGCALRLCIHAIDTQTTGINEECPNYRNLTEPAAFLIQKQPFDGGKND